MAGKLLKEEFSFHRYTGAGKVRYRAPIPTGNVGIGYTYHTIGIVIFYYTYIKCASGASYTYIW